MSTTTIFLVLAGALGALAKDILEDNKITIPKKIDDALILGSLGGIITGSIVGYLVDSSITTAFLAGYAGKAVIENLLSKGSNNNQNQTQTIEEIIRYIAKEEGIDPDLAVRVAKCESSLDPKAIHVNTDGSQDRGLFQINNKYHPEVSDEEAFDPVLSTKFFCKAFKQGHLDWWKSTQNCWKK